MCVCVHIVVIPYSFRVLSLDILNSSHCNVSYRRCIPILGHMGVLCFWSMAVPLSTYSAVSTTVLFGNIVDQSWDVLLWKGSVLFEMV